MCRLDLYFGDELLDELLDELSCVLVLHLEEQIDDFEVDKFKKSCNFPRDISVTEFVLKLDIIIIMIYKKIL